MINLRKIFLLTFLCIILLYGSAGAAEDPEETGELKLEDCINLAIKNNLSIDVAESQLKFSEAKVSEAEAAKYPQIKLSGDAGYYSYQSGLLDVIVEEPGFSNFPSTISLERKDFDASFKFGIEQLIYDGGRTEAKIFAAEIEKENKRLEVLTAVEDVKYSVQLAFYAAIKAKKQFALSLENVTATEENLKLSEALFKEGIVPEVDAVTAEVALTKAKMLSGQAENEYKKSIGNLNLLMGCDIKQSTELKGNTDFSIINIDENLAVEKALEERPEINQLNLLLAYKERGLNIGEMAFSPTISANAGYIVRDEDSLGRKNFYVGLGVDFPVFNIAEYSAKKEMGEATLEESKKQKELLKQKIILEVHNALLDLNSAGEALILTEQEVSLAELNLKIAKSRYEQGLGIILELTAAQLSLHKAQADYVDSIYNYKIALVALEHTLGCEIDDTDRKGDN